MISVLIPILDDYDNLIETLNSIYSSTLNEIEVIIIDSSKIPILLPNKYKNIKIIRQEKNIGPAQSRHLAAKQAKYDILFMADSHTYFPKKWDEILIKSFQNNKKQISAFPVILSDTWDRKNLDIFKTYFGSNIYIKHFCSPDNFFDSYINYEYSTNKLNAIKLAAYGIDKEYFFKLRGFEEIRQWGSDELCLSIKILLDNGEINLLPELKFVHIHNKSIIIRNMSYIYYNKIRIAQTFMDEDSYKYMISILPTNNIFFSKTWEFINRDKDEIQEHKNFYKSIFKKDFKQLRRELNIIE